MYGDIHELMSGRQRGVWPALIRAGMQVSSWPYHLATRLRNLAFDCHWTSVHEVSVPVISVGNLTAGGTGKSPMVAWIAKWLLQQNVRVALVSRGYKAKAGTLNDEARELERQLGDVPHICNPDRVAGARQAIQDHGAELIVLDDGFQHRRIHRDLNVLLVDAINPFGYEHLLPRGLLRESMRGLHRADVVVLTRADAVDERQRAELRNRIQRLAPHCVRAEVAHAPVELQNHSGETCSLSSLQRQPIAAFCGIGNPLGFRHTLERCEYEVAAWREFPDHFDYAPAAVDQITQWASEQPVAAALCTQKDLVKIPRDQLGDVPLWAVSIEMQFLSGQEAFEQRLREQISQR